MYNLGLAGGCEREVPEFRLRPFFAEDAAHVELWYFHCDVCGDILIEGTHKNDWQ
jgi:hypothetical protein